MTEKLWRVVLGSEAEKDFVRILAYTLNIFGPRKAAVYEATDCVVPNSIFYGWR